MAKVINFGPEDVALGRLKFQSGFPVRHQDTPEVL
jgi:hypothetical protein